VNQPYPDGFFTEWSEERRNAFFAAEARAYDERRPAPPDAELDSREASPPIDLDYVPDTPDYGERDANTQGEELLPKLVPISFVEGEVLKPRKWIVHDGWIPTRKVTLAQGNGGDGKTSLVHQLQSSCATPLPWIGLRVEECASIGFYTEDEEQDLKERQAAIDAAYGQHCASTGKMHLFPRAGEENELLVFDRARKPSLTTFYRQVCEAASDFRARLVVLDVAVDLFGGNEIVRQEVRALFRPLHTLARKIDGAVVMTSHVSQAGIQSDGGHSGSTDWSNAVRSRLYLSRPKGENGEPIDPNARILTRKKANFASIGDTVKLHWKDGVIVPDTLGAPSYFRRPADDVFLALLDEHCTANRQPLSESRNAANFAPRVFASAAANARDGYAIGDFKTAMESLFKSGKIRSVNYGRSGDERRKIVRCDREE
jgi:RecA-family ATPase